MAIALVGLLLLENLLLLSWYPFYFGRGITVFSTWVPAPAAVRSELALESLERAVDDSPALRLVFHPLPDGRVAFRESYAPSFRRRYYPVMRGVVEMDRPGQRVQVVGLCNWNVIAISLGMLSLASMRAKLVVPTLLLGLLLAWSYWMQRRRFLEVAEAVRVQLAQPGAGMPPQAPFHPRR
jgi:hypothetical protein